MSPPFLPTAPTLGRGQPALTEPRPFNRDERILWALRRGVEHATGKQITTDQGMRLLLSISAPSAAVGFAAGVPGGALDATRDYTLSLLAFLRGVLQFYAVVYDPNIVVPTVEAWMTLPGSPERAEKLEEIAELLAQDHPEVADAVRWIPVLELAIKDFIDWLKTNEALLELGAMAGEGLAELIGSEIGTLMNFATPFEQGEYLGRQTGYVITTVLLEVLGY